MQSSHFPEGPKSRDPLFNQDDCHQAGASQSPREGDNSEHSQLGPWLGFYHCFPPAGHMVSDPQSSTTDWCGFQTVLQTHVASRGGSSSLPSHFPLPPFLLSSVSFLPCSSPHSCFLCSTLVTAKLSCFLPCPALWLSDDSGN